MSQYYGAPPPNQFVGGSASAAQNLQFYPSTYSPGVPSQPAPAQPYGYGAPTPGSAGFGGFGGAPGVSGRMGEQGGLRTGWLAAFSTEGYDGEPPLLEELGVNFGHIQMKVSFLNPSDILFHYYYWQRQLIMRCCRPWQYSTPLYV